MVWHFDDFEVDLRAWRLTRGGRAIPLEPKALQLLALLVQRPGEVVTKAEILDQVWKDTAVTENAMVRIIAQIRNALGDHSKEPKYIETVHTRGYRFLAAVTAPAVEITPPERSAFGVRTYLLAAAVLLIVAGGLYYLSRRESPSSGAHSVEAATAGSSIAILPLENLGPPEHQYFADGMTEAITTQLAKLEALKVISHRAVIRYGTDRPAPSAMARALGVSKLVEGSALFSNGRVRITARLLDGATAQTLWGESYEGDLADVLGLQGRVAREIAREIRVRVTADEAERLAVSQAVDPDAYHEYLLGLYAYERALSIDDEMSSHLQEALTRFRAAIARAPTWGEAQAALAQTHLRLAGMSDDHAERLKQYRTAYDLATRAVELDPMAVRGRLVLARSGFFHNGDWEAAERQYREVLKLEPNNADWSYGIYLAYAGRFDESVARLRSAFERWPTSSFTGYQVGLTYVCAGRYDDAVREAAELRNHFNDPLHASLLEAMALAGKGQYAAAVDLLEANRKGLLVNRATTFLNNLAYAAAKAGQHERAWQAVRELKALGGYPPPAVVLALEGRDAAVRQVREIHRRRDYVLLQARCWADYQEFRAIPEIEEIFRAAGISETR